jgi:D-alanyl-D-alanine carboxypeptidase/D-alanyl-D-alanine-endopeptidase (penicillin-binding protein 4)
MAGDMPQIHWRLSALLAATLLLCASAPAKENKSAHKALSAKIESILSAPDLASASWGIKIVALPDGRPWYSLNDNKLFVPASNTKLFTGSAVLALVGADYKFHTTVESSAAPDKYGRLSGDIYLVGRGDPNLSGRTLPYAMNSDRKLAPVRVLEDLADQLVRRGVKIIDGAVVGDDSYYIFQRYGEGWANDDMLWDYGAPVSALAINDNVLFLNVRPGERPGDKALLTLQPFTNYFSIDNTIVTAPPGVKRNLGIHREPGSLQLTLWGTIPLDDAGDDEVLAIEDPAEFAAQEFRDILVRRGILIFGGTRARHIEIQSLPPAPEPDSSGSPLPPATLPLNAPPAAPPLPPFQVLAGYDSPPLLQDLTVINKVSQNLHAEMHLRLLGKLRGGVGSVEAGLAVLRGFLGQVGLQPQDYAFYDGSGLSRENLVSPDAVVKLLQYDAAQPWAAQFLSTLPVAGVDGSLADRFKGTPAEGRVQAKTGSHNHVTTLSGYATTLRGDKVAFSILSNNHYVSGRRARQAIDQIVQAIIQEGGSGK